MSRPGVRGGRVALVATGLCGAQRLQTVPSGQTATPRIYINAGVAVSRSQPVNLRRYGPFGRTPWSFPLRCNLWYTSFVFPCTRGFSHGRGETK